MYYKNLMNYFIKTKEMYYKILSIQYIYIIIC